MACLTTCIYGGEKKPLSDVCNHHWSEEPSQEKGPKPPGHFVAGSACSGCSDPSGVKMVPFGCYNVAKNQFPMLPGLFSRQPTRRIAGQLLNFASSPRSDSLYRMASPAPTLAALSAAPVTPPPRSQELYQTSLANAVTAARIADQLRGQNIVVLDLTNVTSIVDFFVIATGTSSRQMHAIADEVNRKLKHEDGNRRISIEGYRTEGNWILIDFGDVVLHVFTPEGRSLYNLEQLWGDAPRIDWQAPANPA